MKTINNKLISKFIILNLILVINACQNDYKCSVFCNVKEHTIHNKELNFYQDANEKPVKINNTYYVKYHLESKKYGKLYGFWGRESDTIFFFKSLEYKNKYPMLIITDSIEQQRRIGGRLPPPIPYDIKIIKLEFLSNDTIYTMEHRTGDVHFEISENDISKVEMETFESKRYVEKRIFKLSLKNGILDYKREKGFLKGMPLPYSFY